MGPQLRAPRRFRSRVTEGTARRSRTVPFLALLLVLALSAAGCGGDGGSDDDYPPYTPPDCSATVEGTAYYPFYDHTGEPTYYDEENHDIIVTLHEFDGHPYEDWATGTSGAYLFDCVPPGTYFLSAYLEEYDAVDDLYYVYYAETAEFHVSPEEWITDLNLFLEFSHTEP